MKKKIIITSLICFFLSINLHSQIQQQEYSMWCWASCIQSCLSQANYSTSQSSIVSRLTGWPKNRPARINEVVSLLKSYNLNAWSVSYPANSQQLYNTLLDGWKLIAFVNPSNNPNVGHFIMLQGISQNGFIIVSDPTYGNTYTQDKNILYNNWKWSSSIVVGKPQSKY